MSLRNVISPSSHSVSDPTYECTTLPPDSRLRYLHIPIQVSGLASVVAAPKKITSNKPILLCTSSAVTAFSVTGNTRSVPNPESLIRNESSLLLNPTDYLHTHITAGYEELPDCVSDTPIGLGPVPRDVKCVHLACAHHLSL